MLSRTPARERLMTAAARLFYADGIAATGVDLLARSAGLSKPTLYANFPSKTALVVAVLEGRHAQRAADLTAHVAAVGPAERPLAVFGWLAGWYERDGARGCAFLNAAAEFPDSTDPVRTAVSAEKRWLRWFLTSLAQGAGLAEPARVGSALQLLIDGVAARVLVEGLMAAPDAVAQAAGIASMLIAAAAPGAPGTVVGVPGAADSR